MTVRILYEQRLDVCYDDVQVVVVLLIINLLHLHTDHPFIPRRDQPILRDSQQYFFTLRYPSNIHIRIIKAIPRIGWYQQITINSPMMLPDNRRQLNPNVPMHDNLLRGNEHDLPFPIHNLQCQYATPLLNRSNINPRPLTGHPTQFQVPIRDPLVL